ncbi:MAG: DUF3168 domain-containing protein [Sphingobium sp.]|nr:DUF3168 domain-containing protein [Sphingobium sp.]
MNAEVDIRAALLALLRGDGALMAQVNRIYDEAPVKATPPMVVVGQCTGDDWGTKDRPGRELRIGITAEDDKESATRLSNIMGNIDQIIAQLPASIAGWQLGSIRLIRSRLLRTNALRWNGVMDYRIRVLAGP